MDETENHQSKTRTKMLKKLNAVIVKEGFQQLKMDDIAKSMDVSRATMYKYFSSKEEVIEGVVGTYEDYINKLLIPASEVAEPSFGTRFQQQFEQSVMLAGNITDVFLKELQAIYPDLYDRLKDVMHQREQKILEFYEDGMTQGIFNRMNPKFILLQDNVLLREIIDFKYLLINQVSLQQVLHDYYMFKKVQLFQADKLSMADDSQISPIIDYIVQKFNRALF